MLIAMRWLVDYIAAVYLAQAGSTSFFSSIRGCFRMRVSVWQSDGPIRCLDVAPYILVPVRAWEQIRGSVGSQVVSYSMHSMQHCLLENVLDVRYGVETGSANAALIWIVRSTLQPGLENPCNV